MKILLVNWMDMENPMAGGAEVHLNEIFRRFVLRGDDVTLVSSGYKGSSKTGEYDGIRIIRTGNRETFNFTAPRVIRKLDKDKNFDLIVDDINKIPLFTPLYLKKPILTVIPHLFGSTVFRETNPVIASYVYFMERPIPYIYRNAVFEVISESTAADIIKRGVNPGHVRVVHCGMDHDTYNIDKSLEKFEQKTILYVGRIKKYKSVDVIIRALPEILLNIPGARLVIVGSGDNLSELKRLAEKLGVSGNVKFTGFVTMDDKVDWMRRSHVIVNPSPKEGWGLTNIEANACGTAAVASDADGLRDSVKDGETGLLFPYGNHSVLAEKVINILKDNELYERLTNNSTAWAQTFTWDNCAEKTMKIADEIVSRK
ncbi:glycosyltransferase family 4 protein [Candidatus Latescibacterota bacterium]